MRGCCYEVEALGRGCGGRMDYLVQHVGYLLSLHQLLGLQVLSLHLTLLGGQAVNILLNVLQIHVHDGDTLLLVPHTGD